MLNIRTSYNATACGLHKPSLFLEMTKVGQMRLSRSSPHAFFKKILIIGSLTRVAAMELASHSVVVCGLFRERKRRALLTDP